MARHSQWVRYFFNCCYSFCCGGRPNTTATPENNPVAQVFPPPANPPDDDMGDGIEMVPPENPNVHARHMDAAAPVNPPDDDMDHGIEMVPPENPNVQPRQLEDDYPEIIELSLRCNIDKLGSI